MGIPRIGGWWTFPSQLLPRTALVRAATPPRRDRHRRPPHRHSHHRREPPGPSSSEGGRAWLTKQRDLPHHPPRRSSSLPRCTSPRGSRLTGRRDSTFKSFEPTRPASSRASSTRSSGCAACSRRAIRKHQSGTPWSRWERCTRPWRPRPSRRLALRMGPMPPTRHRITTASRCSSMAKPSRGYESRCRTTRLDRSELS